MGEYDHVLFPTDGSDAAARVLDYALDVASEHGATLHVINVVDTVRESVVHVREGVIDVLEREGERIVAEAARCAAERDVPVVPEVLRGTPSRAIVDYGRRAEVDLLVVPTHGRRGLKRVLLGSVTERVVNTAPVPVIAVNPHGDRPLAYPCRDLLVPTDGSRGAARALAEGIAVAKATGATLHLLHVIETGRLGLDARSVVREGGLADRANEIVTDATATAETASVESIESAVERGDPARAILGYVEEHGIDLAALGTHGRTDFSRYALGGVAAKIIRASPAPVMWVREPETDAADSGER